MIKMYTARTSEMDEIAEAIGEIKRQMDFAVLKKNPGVDFLPYGFINSGAL